MTSSAASPRLPRSLLAQACGTLIATLHPSRPQRLFAGSVAFSLAASLWPVPAASSSVSASVNAWLGGHGNDWFTAANWSGGNVLQLPASILPTVISPVKEEVNGIPTGNWYLPQGEAVLGGSFATPSFIMYAWSGMSQLRLTSGGVLTTSATIGTVSSYSTGQPVQAATVVLDGGQTAGSWNFLENSRVVVKGQYAAGQANWSGTLGALEIAAGATFGLGSSLAVNSIVNNSDSFAVAAGTVASLRGSVVNAGVFTIAGDSSSGVAMARMAADTTLSGAGTTVLSHKDYSIIGANAIGRTLTIATGHTLRGSGQLGSVSYSAINVVNQGTVIADGQLAYYGSSFDNSAGQIQVTAGATLANAGTIAGGTLRQVDRAAAARGMQLLAASPADASLSGGGIYRNLTFSGNFSASGGTLEGVTVEDQFTVASGSTVSITGNNVITGRLILAGDSTAGVALLRLTGNTTLSGSGSTVLTHKDYSIVGANAASRTLTIAADHTLRGSGQVGSGSYTGVNVINQGTVIADGALSYYGTSFDNTAGLIQVGSGAVFTNAGTVSGGTLQGLGGGATVGGSGIFGALTLQGPLDWTGGTFNGVTIQDTATLKSGSTGSITGNNAVAGGLTLAGDGTSGVALLRLTGNTTLAGNGSTVLTHKDYSIIGANAVSRTLTIAAGHTLRGSGQVGSGSYTGVNVVNQGTVIANGQLSYYGTSFDNTAGLVQIASGAVFTNAGTVSGGALQGLGGGATLGGSGIFSALTLQGPLNWTGGTFNGVTIQDTATLKSGSTGGITGNNAVAGSLTLAGDGTSGVALLRLSGNTTLSGNGSTVLTHKDYSIIGANAVSRTLTIAADHTLRGSGQVGSGSYTGINVVNHGTVIADGALSYYGTSFDNTAGLVQIASDAVFTNAGTVSGGALQGLGDTSRLSGSGNYQNLALAGTLRVTGGDTVNVAGSIAGTGSLTIAGDGTIGTALLRLVGNTTLSGAGTTVLSNASYSAIDANATNRTLTIGAGHTLRGSGQLGHASYYGINVVNQGTVIADGSLSYRGTSFDNAAGLIRLADGASFTSAGTISGGSIVSVGAGTLGGTGSFSALALHGTLAWTGGGLDGVTLHDSVTLRGAAIGSVSGTLTNLGTLTVAGDGTTGTALLRLTGNTTLVGAGTTVLSSAAYSAIDANTSGRVLTIAADHTVRGNGQLGSGSYYGIGIVNKGTVIADGTLSYRGNGFDNADGLIQVANSAVFYSSGTVTGGTVKGLDANSRISGSGSYQNLALVGTLQVAGGDTVNIGGAIANSGTLTIAGDGNTGSAMLRLTGNATVSGPGTTVLKSAAYSAIDANTGGRMLTIAADHTVRGSGQLGSNSYYGIGVINQGKVIVEGSLSYRGNGFDNSAGLVQVADGSVFSTSGTVTGGTVQGVGANSRINGSGSFQNLALSGPLQVAGGDTANINGTLANTGTLTIAGDGNTGAAMLRLGGNATLSGNGSTVLKSAAYSAIDANTSGRILTIAADHTVRGSGQLGSTSYYGISVVNLGTVVADGSLSHRGTTFDNTAGTISIGTQGLFAASGSALKLSDASTLSFAIGADTSDGIGSVQGLLQLAGNASFDGRLILDFSGYQAAVGDSFTLIDFSGTRSGSFDNVFAAGYGLDVHYNLHDVTITVASITAVPEPQALALMLAGLGVVGAVARRRRAP